MMTNFTRKMVNMLMMHDWSLCCSKNINMKFKQHVDQLPCGRGVALMMLATISQVLEAAPNFDVKKKLKLVGELGASASPPVFLER